MKVLFIFTTACYVLDFPRSPSPADRPVGLELDWIASEQ
jgi:hypothetical protein